MFSLGAEPATDRCPNRSKQTPLGRFFITVGMGLFCLHALQSVFANRLWAVVISGNWIALDSLFPDLDVRRSQSDAADLDLLCSDDPTEESTFVAAAGDPHERALRRR